MDREMFRLEFFNKPEGFKQLEQEAFALERQRRNALLLEGRLISAPLAELIAIQALDDILELHGLPVELFRQQNAALLLLSPKLT